MSQASGRETSPADCATQAGPATVIIDVTVQLKPPCPITNRRSNMTTAKPTATTPRPPDGFRFEDPPEHQPDDMTSFNHLTITGSAYLSGWNTWAIARPRW